MPGQRGARVPVEMKFCPVQGRVTEHRKYLIRHRPNGDPYYQVRCYECLKAKDLAAKQRRGISVGKRGGQSVPAETDQEQKSA